MTFLPVDTVFASVSDMSSRRYASRLITLVKLIPPSLDHISDFLVLAELWLRGSASLFVTGLVLDLLPGPVTAVQFGRFGHPWWKCLLLLFHPINLYVHTALAECTHYEAAFSSQVALYAMDVQGLLEAPMQLIFTLTLVCLRYSTIL